MGLTYKEFKIIFEFICSITGRSVNENVAKFYHSHLQNIDGDVIKKAFNYFASKGVLPTVEQVLSECGFSAPLDRETSEIIREQLSKREKMGNENLTEDTEYGSYAFRFEFIGIDRDAALKLFETKHANLEKKGWKIESAEVSACKIPKAGSRGGVDLVSGFVEVVYAYRESPQKAATRGVSSPQGENAHERKKGA